MKLLCYVREKIYVRFYNWQDTAHSMLRITMETKARRHQAVHDWFDRAGFLKPDAESAFRAANPRPIDKENRPELNEYKINKAMFKLSTFIKNRKINRR